MSTQEELESLAGMVDTGGVIALNRDLVWLRQRVTELSQANDVLRHTQVQTDAYYQKNTELLREDVAAAERINRVLQAEISHLYSILDTRAKEILTLQETLTSLRNQQDKDNLPIYVFAQGGHQYKVKERTGTNRPDPSKIDAIKKVRELTGCDLRGAKNLVEGNASMRLSLLMCDNLNLTLWDMGYFLQMQ